MFTFLLLSFLSDELQVRHRPDGERHPAEGGAERLGEEVRRGRDPTLLQAERRGGGGQRAVWGELVSDGPQQREGQWGGDGLLQQPGGRGAARKSGTHVLSIRRGSGSYGDGGSGFYLSDECLTELFS